MRVCVCVLDCVRVRVFNRSSKYALENRSTRRHIVGTYPACVRTEAWAGVRAFIADYTKNYMRSARCSELRCGTRRFGGGGIKVGRTQKSYT